MRLRLVVALLVCAPSWGLHPTEDESPLFLVEELEEPASIEAMKKALENKEMKKLESLARQAQADTTAGKQEKAESSPPPQPGDPVDVMQHFPELAFRLQHAQADRSAREMSKRLEKEGAGQDVDSVAGMKGEIANTIQKNLEMHVKALPKSSRTWDSVFQSEMEQRQKPRYGLTRSQRESEMDTAERQQLLNREHAVANAEQNLAYLEHQAQHKVHQAESKAQASESAQLEKVEEKEHAAESAEAKARADEAGALQLKADDKNKLQKLKSENKALRREVNTADTKQKLLALELQADTSKAVQAARKAVKRQAALDKEEKQSELHTLRSSAEKLKKKLHNERSKLRVEHSEVRNQESENRKLQKKVASDMTFTQQEVRNAVTKAHLVSEKLWQPKVVMLTHQMEEVQDRAQAKVEATEKAVKEWAHTALSLKDKLEEQASAEKILGRAHRDVKAAHLHMAQMKTAVARANEDAVAAKSMLQSTDQKLSNAIAEKQLYHNQVKKLQDQEGVMLKKQTVLTLQSKRMKRKLKEMQDKLNEARAKLRPQQQENSSDKRKVKFATNKDFVEITSNQPGGGAEHLLPHKLNLDIQDPKNHDA